MKKTKLLLFASIMLFSTACMDDNMNDNQVIFPDEQVKSQNTSLKLSPQEAEEIALDFKSSIGRTNRSSIENNTTSGVIAITRLKMKQQTAPNSRSSSSSENDTILYVVNFANEGGYAVIIANKKSEYPVLALIETGTFDIEIVDETPNSYAFIWDMMEYYAEDIEPSDRDGGPLPWGNDSTELSFPLETKLIYGQWTVDKQKGPFLQTHWHQGYPYNNETPYDKNDDGVFVHSRAGCAAVASGQILAYHKLPSTYDWDNIIGNEFSEYGKESVSTLVHDIGVKLGMSYHWDHSSADSEDVPPILRSYGLQCSNLISYDKYQVTTEISNNRLVYMRGRSKKKTVLGFTYYEGGHAWVVDGLIALKRHVKEIVTYSNHITIRNYYESTSYIHCNFGWGGSHDGYYLGYIFDTREGSQPDYEPTRKHLLSEDGEEGTSRLYQYSLKMIKNIHIN